MITGSPSWQPVCHVQQSPEQSTGITGFNDSARVTVSVTWPLHNSTHAPYLYHTYSLRFCFQHGGNTKYSRKQSAVPLKQ